MVTTTVERLSPTRVKLNITVTPDELKPSITHAYEHIAESVNIPGFRKGKVPPRVIDQRVGWGAVIEHAVNDALSGFYRQAASEEKTRSFPIDAGGSQVIRLVAEGPEDFDQATLRPEAGPALAEVKTRIGKSANPVVVEGHTDAKGADDYNQRSYNRAAKTDIDSERTICRSEGSLVRRLHDASR